MLTAGEMIRLSGVSFDVAAAATEKATLPSADRKCITARACDGTKHCPGRGFASLSRVYEGEEAALKTHQLPAPTTCPINHCFTFDKPATIQCLIALMLPTLFIPQGGGPLPLLGDPGHTGLVSFLKAVPRQMQPRLKAILRV